MEKTKIITYQIDYINPTERSNPTASYIPGFRGQDQLNIYTYDYVYKTKDNLTSTNPWGVEVAVNKNNIVIEINDRVKIPRDGYVISGNSKGKDFIDNNIELGQTITYDIKTMKLSVSIDKIHTTLYTLNRKISQIKQRVKKANNDILLYNRDEVTKQLNEINVLFNKIKKLQKNQEEFDAINKQILNKIDMIYILTTPCNFIESRGVWYRPHEQSLKELQETLEVMKRCNLNTLYVEAFYNGSIIGKSNITTTSKDVIDYKDSKHNDDYLKALIDEAHKLNIEVHAWVENFFVGENVSFDKNYPDYFRMVNYDYSTTQGDGTNNHEVVENGFIFLDPANPKVQKYVLSIYQELLTNYDLDGLHIDYVRYPNGNLNIETSNGYSNYAMTEFKKKYGYNSNEDVRKLVLDAKINKQWTEYRCSKITSFVSKVHMLVKSIKPNCKISMAVVPETEYAIANKMQDWVKWVKRKWIDITLPMAYYFGTSEIIKATHSLVKFNGLNAFSYTGISPNYEHARSINNAYQIEACINSKSQGYAIFQLEDLLHNIERQNVLIQGNNRYKSINPHRSFNELYEAYKKELELKTKYFKINNIASFNQFLSMLDKTTSIEDVSNLIKDYQKQAKSDLDKNSFISFKTLNQLFLKTIGISKYQEANTKKMSYNRKGKKEYIWKLKF